MNIKLLVKFFKKNLLEVRSEAKKEKLRITKSENLRQDGFL